MKEKQEEVGTHTRRGIGTSAISGSGAGGSDRDATVGRGRLDVVGSGLVALGGCKGGGIEGSLESVLGTTSSRGVSREAVRASQ